MVARTGELPRPNPVRVERCLRRVGWPLSLALSGACAPSLGPWSVVLEPLEVSSTVTLVTPYAILESEIRRAIARNPSLAVKRSDTRIRAQVRIELRRASFELEPFANPRRRAASYRARVELIAWIALVGSDGPSSLGGKGGHPSPTLRIEAEGQTRALAPPGETEALEGVARIALARSAEEAATRLATAIALNLDRFGRSAPPVDL